MGALPEGQRFSSQRQPADEARGRRTSYLWLRQLLSEAAHDEGPDGDTHREAIGRHLIEVASKWEVVVKGHGDDAMPVANGSASVAAAELLFKYDMGRPPPGSDEWRLALAEHIRKVARDQADLALSVLGNRINGMTDDEKVAFFHRCSTDPSGFLKAAEEELASREQRIAIDVAPQDSVGPVAEPETAASPPAAQPEVPPCAANEAQPEAGAFNREPPK